MNSGSGNRDLVNGEGHILTPYKIETPETIDIKLGNLVDDALCQIWCKSDHEGLKDKGKYVKYNTFDFIYLYIFSSTHLQVIPHNGLIVVLQLRLIT